MSPRRKETGETSSASSKRQKKKQQQSTGGEEDRISCLPDTILHHILSFLDMKHVVQTSILSKRWKHLWASLGSLTFDSELFYSPQTNQLCDGFSNFVEQVLLLRDSSSDIQKFHFINYFQNCKIESHRLNTWIIYVIKSKVRDLTIEVWGDVGLRLPNRLFTCNSLTSMMLVSYNNGRRWSITLPVSDSSSMCLPNLLFLQLESVSFNDENLTNNFFLSCPKLESLYLEDVKFLHMNVNISAFKLETFAVKNLGEDHGHCHWPNTKFKLHAPNLSYLGCEDYMSNHYILEDLSSLVKADIDMKVEEEDQNPGLHYSKLPAERKQMYAQRMMQFLRALHYVKDLQLSACFLEVVSGSFDLFESEPTQLCDLTCLWLQTWLSVDTTRAIMYLLNISPNVESLFLKISKTKSVSSNIGENPEAEVSLQCVLDKLGCVEIRGAIGCVNELKFLEILLKNAKVLKKLVVYTSKEQLPDRQKRFTKFTEKLLTFPKASSDITILVC